MAPRGCSGNVGGLGAAQLSLGPGQAKSFLHPWILERPDDCGSEDHKTYNSFSGSSGSVTWADETIRWSGCGGYA
ncbi:MspA family porin [Nocardia sp. NPDC050697]|uniref:MspA family porin n=1 Tax=Nocardia sp. NPDC050697 TaxID=3155158 RepID=UPI0033E051AF